MPRNAIVFVESIESGLLRPARYVAQFVGPEVYRQQVFRSFKDLEALDDQDLFDLAKSCAVPVTTKTDTAQLLWFQANRTQSMYLGPKEKDNIMAKAKRKPKNAVKIKAETRGRPSPLHGKKLYVKVEANPRRKGSIGAKSFNLIKNGMLVEDYIAAGGRMQDLRWDLTHKYVEAR